MEDNNYSQQSVPIHPVQQPQYSQHPYYGMPQIKPQMGFVRAIKTVLVEKYCCFKGRARRSEYWNWVLAYFLLSFILSTFNMIMTISGVQSMDMGDPLSRYNSPIYIVMALVGLVLFLPNLGVTVRRLHDTGRTGWWIAGPIILYLLLLLVSFWVILGNAPMGLVFLLMFLALGLLVLGIIILVWLCHDSDPRPNKYGSSPKYQ